MKERKLKTWQMWGIFGAAMVVVFMLGLLVSVFAERRAEEVSIYQNRKVVFNGQEPRNELFKSDFPREYETWAATADTTFKSKYNSSEAVDILAERPNMVILWAGYAFSWDYTSPRGHMHAVEDMVRTLRTGAPETTTAGSNQPGTCWTCKSPDVPRLMQEKGIDNYYKANWAMWGNEVANPIGCSDCHDAETMDLHISRPALIEAFERQGKDITKVSQQEMRSLVCAQCHVEYYFKNNDDTPEHDQYLTFPWDKGLTVENIEEYYDETGYYDYIHALSKTPILKAQHPGYETSQLGIHAQRGVSCADCHMPYTAEGGVKFSDHHVQSPLASIDRTCQQCHRQSEETLRQNVYERQQKCMEIRDRLEDELVKAHIEAKAAWEAGASEEEMKPVLSAIRKGQWRWDFAVASHGASFHAPQEIARIMSHGLYYTQQARMALSKVLMKHGIDEVMVPDISTKDKAQKYIGLDMNDKENKKKIFMEKILPQWQADHERNERVVKL